MYLKEIEVDVEVPVTFAKYEIVKFRAVAKVVLEPDEDPAQAIQKARNVVMSALTFTGNEKGCEKILQFTDSVSKKVKELTRS